MILNLPIEVWFVFLGAGALFLFPLVVLFIAHRILMKRNSAKQS
jgi:hypothetical protein